MADLREEIQTRMSTYCRLWICLELRNQSKRSRWHGHTKLTDGAILLAETQEVLMIQRMSRNRYFQHRRNDDPDMCDARTLSLALSSSFVRHQHLLLGTREPRRHTINDTRRSRIVDGKVQFLRTKTWPGIVEQGDGHHHIEVASLSTSTKYHCEASTDRSFGGMAAG